MKIKELFAEKVLDWVHESELFEMAWKRQRAEDKMHGLSKPILNHLIKILKWKDELNYKKHCNNISSSFIDIQSIILKNGKPPVRNFSYDCLIIDNNFSLETIHRFIRQLNDYHQLQELASDSEVFYKIVKIINDVCIDIEKNKFESIEDYL